MAVSTSNVYSNFPSGFPFSFGVFQDYYSTQAPFSEEPSGIVIIGSSAMVNFSFLDGLLKVLH